MKRRSFVYAALSIIPASAARGQDSSDAALLAAARQQGRVVWYTSLITAQGARPLAQAFEARYPGVKVDIVSGTNDDLVLKLLQEGRAGHMGADVSHGGSAVIPAKNAGLVLPYTQQVASAYLPAYRDPSGYWTAQDVLFLGVSVNTDLVPAEQAPKTPQDLLDPKWKGKIAWCSQLSQGGPPGYIGAVLLSMGQDTGMTYLRKLAKQRIVNVVGNQRVMLDQVIVGEYPIALMTFNHHAAISARDGAPVNWLGLSPVVTNLDAAFLLKGSPHPDAAKLFLDFLLSRDGQTIFRNAGYIPASPAVETILSGLTPEAGHFTPTVISPDLVDRFMSDWIKVYRDLFA